MEDIRINKYLAHSGVCSRRDADKLIDAGRVKINNIVADKGSKVSDGDVVAVDDNVVRADKGKVVIAFNKPVGVVVSEKDQHADVLYTDYVKYHERLTYAGRLDKDSEGLLLLTNDGDFIQAVMKGSNAHEKEYEVKLNKPVQSKDIEKLKKGIYIKDLDRTTKPCFIERISEYRVRMIITEGLNRQIRRMWKIVGYQVLSLKRVRVVNIQLGDLEVGKWRVLSEEEMHMLYSSVGLNYDI